MPQFKCVVCLQEELEYDDTEQAKREFIMAANQIAEEEDMVVVGFTVEEVND